jgi:hypothetical protein
LELQTAPVVVQSKGVDNRGEATTDSSRDDLVEKVEGDAAGIEIVFTASHYRSETIRGDDFFRPKPRCCPMTLAGTRRPHQYD